MGAEEALEKMTYSPGNGRFNSARFINFRIPMQALIPDIHDLLDVNLLIEDDSPQRSGRGIAAERSEKPPQRLFAFKSVGHGSTEGRSGGRENAMLIYGGGHLALEGVAESLDRMHLMS